MLVHNIQITRYTNLIGAQSLVGSDLLNYIGAQCYIMIKLLLPIFLYFGSCCAYSAPLLSSPSEERFRENLKTLSSDTYEGRKPSTAGGKKTIATIQKEFEKAGLAPGNGNSYLQATPIASLTTERAEVHLINAGESNPLEHGTDILAFARTLKTRISVAESQLVFVGFGVIAPEYAWNDYQDVNVSGKTAIILSNDPGHLAQDGSLFLGKGVTYYAKDSYKYEEAERQGAVAAFIIHDTRLSNLDWAKHVAKFSKERQVLNDSEGAAANLLIQGYISAATTAKTMALSGMDYELELSAAMRLEFKAKPLTSFITLNVNSALTYATSYNVLGLIPGLERPDEVVIYLAHWDHLGIDTSLEGDQVFNGAKDNAAGIASLIELAHLFKSTANNQRSVLIMAVTAEESGLLGSYYYAKNPVVPLHQTVGAINLDMMNLDGKTRDVLVHGFGNSPLMDAAIHEAIVKKQGRVAKPFGRLEAGIAYRNDGFSFNRSGVPAIGLASGSEHIENGTEWMDAQADDYFGHRYHQVADEYSVSMDVSGALLDVMALYLTGQALANSSEFAQWYDDKEFKPLRDAQLAP